jgi:uncharacterized protein YbaA (DUF1428 family)
MSYIDGFVAAVPQANKQAYLDHVREALTLFKDHGAARTVENWADDVPEGKVTDFHRSVRKKDDEAVLFSWIEWPSREARDSGMKAMMQDERMKTLGIFRWPAADLRRLLADRRDRISQGHRLCGWVRRARPRRQSRCLYQDGAERVACLQRGWRAARRRSLGR